MEKHSPDVAVSSGDHPVLVDQGTSTEMESVGLLSSAEERPGLLHQVAKTWRAFTSTFRALSRRFHPK